MLKRLLIASTFFFAPGVVLAQSSAGGFVGAGAGSSSARPSVPTSGVAFFFDTDLGKLLYGRAGHWYDMTGAQVTDYVPPVDAFSVPDDTNFFLGNYAVYCSPFNKAGLHAGDTYANSVSGLRSTFPNSSTINWNWPTGYPCPNGVWGFNSIQFGNYYGAAVPVPIKPGQINTIQRLKQTISARYEPTNTAGYDALIDFFLTNAKGDGNNPITEISIFLHTNPSTKSYCDSLIQLGTYTDPQGRAWKASFNTGGAQGPIYLIYPVNLADIQGTVDVLAFLTWCTQLSSNALNPNLWVNGIATGVEPYQGAGAITFDTLTTDYIPPPVVLLDPALPARTNFISAAASNDLTNAQWASDPDNGSTLTAGQFLEKAQNSRHGITTAGGSPIAKAGTSKRLRFSVDVDTTLGRSFLKLQMFSGDYQSSVQVQFDIANQGFTQNTASGSFSNPVVDVNQLTNGKTRCGVTFTSGTETALRLALYAETGSYADTYLGDTAKGMKLGNLFIYDTAEVVGSSAGNILGSPNAIGASPWYTYVGGGLPAIGITQNAAADPNGEMKASQIDFAAIPANVDGNTAQVVLQNIGTTNSLAYKDFMWIKGKVGGEKVRLFAQDNGGSGTNRGNLDVTATTSWVKYTLPFTSGTVGQTTIGFGRSGPNGSTPIPAGSILVSYADLAPA